MKYATLALLSVSISLIMGCICGFKTGGGGSIHNPPLHIKRGYQIELDYELSVWGQGAGKMSQRYKDVKCHYRTNAQGIYTNIVMNVKAEYKDKVVYTCVIPADATKTGSQLQYYFDEKFDGHYNRRDEKPIQIEE